MNKQKQRKQSNRRKNPLQIEIYRLEEGGEDSSFDLIRRIVRRIVDEENRKVRGELSIILANDKLLQNLNRRFLNQDWATDVIAFPFGEEEKGPWGEIYISEERAKDQALEYHVPFLEELLRLVIHGVLHLLGYQDGTTESRDRMERRENYFLQYMKCI
ncbi:rRNA maturation RNase YbeY [bacterium]|nr:rRNA maturation RNase YbeY [bacterium]